ncbi:MAG: DUF723 domain-containing protein [Clostridia bacterium]|jgi:hypothetical protein
MSKRLTTEEFIIEACKVHRNKYDYSKVDYKDSNTKVLIGCPKHGFFEQNPCIHRKGSGCPRCSGKSHDNNETFIEKARIVHKNKYSYDLVKYTNNSTKVHIKCNNCGLIFEQAPSSHLSGQGCSKCAGTKKSNTDEFIDKAKLVHSTKYTYDKVEYVNSKTKVLIFCNKCKREFWQKPNGHLSGQGCPHCAGKTITTEDFIIRSIKVHGQKYNYEKANYVSSNEEVIVECPEHGEFLIKASYHLSGSGCPSCTKNVKLTTKSFIDKAISVHGYTYDYSKITYVNSQRKVNIVCKKHGSFQQTPANHLQGQGCYSCRSEKIGVIKRSSLEEFISQAQKVFGDFYNYSKVDYKNNHTKVLIICPIHGEFYKTPNCHISSKAGCPTCSKLSQRKKRLLGKEEFIKRAVKRHGSKYDYSKVSYVSATDFVKIICTFHGEFQQKAYLHIAGSGCPKCNSSKGELRIHKFLDTNKVFNKSQFRIRECQDKRPLPFDFAIFEDKDKTRLKCLIEYDGEQHFNKRSFFFKKSEKAYEDRKRKDGIKNNYCLQNCIPFMRIPYWQKDNIEKLLENFLSSI